MELEQLGYTVLSAEEPNQALVHVKTGEVDLVVIEGSAETGDVVASFVSMLGSEKHSPPFVLASSSPQAPKDSARLGAAAFLPKPCHAGDVTHVLARVAPKSLAPRI
ncbi:MAG: response regulator [Myxococcales bacterium]|nr:response regulator [Myxococcales bacterium]